MSIVLYLFCSSWKVDMREELALAYEKWCDVGLCDVQDEQRGSDIPDLETGLCNGAAEASVLREASASHGTGTEVSSGSDGKRGVKPDRTILGLALYGISSLFLATVLMCAKLLGEHFMLVPWCIVF
jgi:hypothetical protein